MFEDGKDWDEAEMALYQLLPIKSRFFAAHAFPSSAWQKKACHTVGGWFHH